MYPNQAPNTMCFFLTDISQLWNSQIFRTLTYFASAYMIQHARGTNTTMCLKVNLNSLSEIVRVCHCLEHLTADTIRPNFH
jgi:hypothetical protein